MCLGKQEYKRGGYMKVKVVFECEIYPTDYTPWFTVNDELKHTDFDCVENLKVFDTETGKEL